MHSAQGDWVGIVIFIAVVIYQFLDLKPSRLKLPKNVGTEQPAPRRAAASPPIESFPSLLEALGKKPSEIIAPSLPKSQPPPLILAKATAPKSEYRQALDLYHEQKRSDSLSIPGSALSSTLPKTSSTLRTERNDAREKEMRLRLRNRRELQQAFVLKEILDSPRGIVSWEL